MNDWKESSIKRRDARHTKSSDEPTKSLKPSKKKDSKKWCKGKEGKGHQTKCISYNEAKHLSHVWSQNWRILICTSCGKELETWRDQTKADRQNKPDWVI